MTKQGRNDYCQLDNNTIRAQNCLCKALHNVLYIISRGAPPVFTLDTVRTQALTPLDIKRLCQASVRRVLVLVLEGVF